MAELGREEKVCRLVREGYRVCPRGLATRTRFVLPLYDKSLIVLGYAKGFFRFGDEMA